jgi:uncharacterized protein
MKAVASNEPNGGVDDLKLVALSYRGYWKSSGRPSQAGIELDAQATLKWALERYAEKHTRFVLWGQSIGAGVASVTTAALLRKDKDSFSRISGILLETPFVDLKAMLIALYPQKFLPYRYLTPFLMSTWNSKVALETIGASNAVLRVMLLQAGDDEIVPEGQAEILKDICSSNGVDVKHHIIPNTLHTEVMMKPQGRRQIVDFLKSFK